MFEFFQSNSYLVNHIVLTETNSTFILMSNMAAFFSEKEIKIQFSNLHKLTIHLDIQAFKLKSIFWQEARPYVSIGYQSCQNTIAIWFFIPKYH